MSHHVPRLGAQRGSALIISLLILVVLTMIGLSTMGGAGLQERMAGNSRDLSLAFQAAEAALREGERHYATTVEPELRENPGHFASEQPGLVAPGTAPDLGADATWAAARVAAADIGGVAEPPRFLIERIRHRKVNDVDNSNDYGNPVDEQAWIRVTARGHGGSRAAQVILQSVYGPARAAAD